MDNSRVPEPVALFLAFVFSVIVFFGGITNLLVLTTHIKYHKKLLRDSKDILTFSLAIGDFIMSALVTPLPLSSAIERKWTTGRKGCVIYGLITMWIGLSSILQLTCISLERYYTLCRINANGICTTRIIQMIAGCWLLAFVASTMPMFGFSEFTFEGFGLHCSIVWKSAQVWYCLFLLLFFYVLPITSIAISYAKMFSVVRKIYRNAAITWGTNAQATRKSYTAQVKFTKQLVVVTCGFMIAWTPYAVLSSVLVLTDIEFDSGWHEMPALFAKTSNIYNPVIYFLMYRRLRRHTSMIFNKTLKIFPSLSSRSSDR
ncbi:melanopsin-like [Dendronephthya gigantea]|uniref:melanopsin-like n=1 Tax=Dendronephthya gigantea TaxID=151771 RepID=UPI00106BA1A1|nr:melanopsin-like [Dendronephthya gigantea]